MHNALRFRIAGLLTFPSHLTPFLLLATLLLPTPLRARNGTALRRYEFSVPRMGTMARMVLYAEDQLQAQKVASAAFDRIEELEEKLSDYREESELNQLCREVVDRPRAVSPELFFVLEESQRFSRLSDGAFDITIGPVVRLWREARRSRRLPEAARLAEARAAVGWRNIELDPRYRTVTLKRPGIRLDLGGIAKGYAVDQALEVATAQKIHSVLVELGGDIRVGGAPPGANGWKIDVESPESESPTSLCSVHLRDMAISTSGDTQQFLESGGDRYSHITDPASGMGLNGAASVTVIAREGISADALATALSVMPVEEGLRLVESIKGVSALIVRREKTGLKFFRSAEFPQACARSAQSEK